MAIRQKVYLLLSVNDRMYVGTVIAPEADEKQVQSEWLTTLKRTDAKKTLNPENFPDIVTFYSSAIDELQEKFPNWDVTFASFVRVGRDMKIREKNIDD